MSDLTYSGKELIYEGNTMSLKYDVLDAYVIENIIIVLLDPDSFIGKEKKFKNLIAFNAEGKSLWEADFPQTRKPDYYWKISNQFPLVVKSFSSNDCQIDLATGKIMKVGFYK